jgi:hypothetical protein
MAQKSSTRIDSQDPKEARMAILDWCDILIESFCQWLHECRTKLIHDGNLAVPKYRGLVHGTYTGRERKEKTYRHNHTRL